MSADPRMKILSEWAAEEDVALATLSPTDAQLEAMCNTTSDRARIGVMVARLYMRCTGARCEKGRHPTNCIEDWTDKKFGRRVWVSPDEARLAAVLEGYAPAKPQTHPNATAEIRIGGLRVVRLQSINL